MEKDKHVIWNNDSLAHDGYEESIKEEWIQEVQAKLGLCEPNDYWVPSGLVDAVKEAAIDDAIAKAMENHEEAINFVQAYRDFADEENIAAIIDEQFEDDLAEQADMNVRDWLGGCEFGVALLDGVQKYGCPRVQLIVGCQLFRLGIGCLELPTALGNRLEDLLLVLHFAFDGGNEVRDEVGSPLHHVLDLRPVGIDGLP